MSNLNDIIKRLEAIEERMTQLEDQLEDRRDHRPRTVESEHEELFAKLRDWRRDRAAADGVKPFVVFGNKVMADIATKRPADRYELSRIKGFGADRMDKYANDVLAIITDHGW